MRPAAGGLGLRARRRAGGALGLERCAEVGDPCLGGAPRLGRGPGLLLRRVTGAREVGDLRVGGRADVRHLRVGRLPGRRDLGLGGGPCVSSLGLGGPAGRRDPASAAARAPAASASAARRAAAISACAARAPRRPPRGRRRAPTAPRPLVLPLGQRRPRHLELGQAPAEVAAGLVELRRRRHRLRAGTARFGLELHRALPGGGERRLLLGALRPQGQRGGLARLEHAQADGVAGARHLGGPHLELEIPRPAARQGRGGQGVGQRDPGMLVARAALLERRHSPGQLVALRRQHLDALLKLRAPQLDRASTARSASEATRACSARPPRRAGPAARPARRGR